MIRPVTFLVDRPRRVRPSFILAEVALVLAVPILAFLGVSTLLESRAGTFVEAPGPNDPGYRALVERTPVSAIVEIVDRRLTGVAVITQPTGETGGAILLVPGELEIEGVRIGSLAVEEAIALLEGELALEIGAVEAIEEARWVDVLGSTTFEIDNPDPIGAGSPPADASQASGDPIESDDPVDDQEQSEGGEAGEEFELLFDVGPVTVDASNIGVILGTPAAGGDPRSLLFRRELVWQALLESEMRGADPVADLLNGVAAGDRRVSVLPTREQGGSLVAIEEDVEAQVLEFVPFPSGARPGDRLRVRVLDRVGGLDLLGLASRLGSQGYEVVEIGNVVAFADADVGNALIVPLGLDDDRIDDLAAAMQADTMVSTEIDSELDGVVTLLVSG